MLMAKLKGYFMFTLEDLQVARGVSGIYFLYNDNKELVYIGKSKNIYLRILEHCFEKTKQFSYFKMVGTSCEVHRDLLEVYLILIYSKQYNLYNKTILGTSFENFYFHLPSSIKEESELDSVYRSANRLKYYIEKDTVFNNRFIVEKE